MTTSLAPNNRRPGWSLLEVTAVMGILGVLVAMTFATLSGAVRIEQASVASFHKLAVQSAVADLFNSEKDPITLIKLKEVYEFFEGTVDSCEDVADVLQNVVVKNS